MKIEFPMSRSLAVVPVLAVAALLAAPPAPVPGVTPDPFRTGIVTVAGGELAQLHAANVSQSQTVTVQMVLYDTGGKPLALSTEVLGPGTSKTLVFRPTAGVARQGIRATVHTMSPAGCAVPPDPIVVASTLEVMDVRSGVAKLVLTE